MLKFNLSKKYNRTIPILVLSAFVLGIVAFISINAFKSFAVGSEDDIDTKVTVGNTPPSIVTGPAESPATSTTAPAAIGATITFSGTATDANSESYYLIFCKTNAVAAGSGGAVPTCPGTAYCSSGTTPIASGTGTSCTYTTTAGDSWSNAWWAFVCDNNATNPQCSTGVQGTGDSGSPLYVNHPPLFTVSSVSAAVNPGGTITWTTTASDPDGNDVKLLVCQTQSITNGACTGATWCSSSLTQADPTCNYVATAPYKDGDYNAYPYIVDQFNLGSSDVLRQGVVKPFTVNNTTPSVSSVTLNGGSAISLTESDVKAVSMTASVTDTNGCTNLSMTPEITAVKGYLYRAAIGYGGCTVTNENSCYFELNCSAGTCTNGVTTYTCSANVAYWADPTTANTQFPTDTWKNTIKATDDDAQTSTGEVSTGVELNELVAGNTTPILLDYGSLSVNGTTVTAIDLTTTTTGNVGLDGLWKSGGSNMCVTAYSPTCSNGTPIPVAQQHFALASTTLWTDIDTLSIPLTTGNKELELNIKKKTDTTTPSGKTWWRIQIPTGTVAGVYHGLNTITYKMSESSEW